MHDLSVFVLFPFFALIDRLTDLIMMYFQHPMEQLHHVRVVSDIPWIKSMRVMVLKSLRVVPRSSIIQLAGSQVISA